MIVLVTLFQGTDPTGVVQDPLIFSRQDLGDDDVADINAGTAKTLLSTGSKRIASWFGQRNKTLLGDEDGQEYDDIVLGSMGALLASDQVELDATMANEEEIRRLKADVEGKHQIMSDSIMELRSENEQLRQDIAVALKIIKAEFAVRKEEEQARDHKLDQVLSEVGSFTQAQRDRNKLVVSHENRVRARQRAFRQRQLEQQQQQQQPRPLGHGTGGTALSHTRTPLPARQHTDGPVVTESEPPLPRPQPSAVHHRQQRPLHQQQQLPQVLDGAHAVQSLDRAQELSGLGIIPSDDSVYDDMYYEDANDYFQEDGGEKEWMAKGDEGERSVA